MTGDPIKFRIIVLLAGDPKMDQFMHACDVFEPFKRLVSNFEPQSISMQGVEGEGGPKWANVVKAIVDGLKERKVLACWVEGQADGAWADPTCRSISTGERWMVFHKWLTACGYPGKHPDLTAAKG